MGPAALAHVLRPLTESVEHNHPDLLVGLASIDDAAVYRLNAEQAVVSTADFFRPWWTTRMHLARLPRQTR